MNLTLKFELAVALVKQADITTGGGTASGMLPILGPALYGGLSSDRHSVRDALALAGASGVGGYAGAAGGTRLGLAVLLAAERGGPAMRLIPSLLALGGSGLAGALGGSAAGSGAASHFLAKDNQPRWMKLLKRSNMTGMGGAASGLLGFPTAAVYGAAASDKHPVRDGLAMGAGTLAGGVGGAGAAMLALGTLLRKDPRALAAVFGAGALGSVAGSAAGAGLTSHLLANDNTPRWRKALGL